MKIYIKKYKILFNKLIMFNLINIIYLFSKAKKNFVFYECYGYSPKLIFLKFYNFFLLLNFLFFRYFK